MAERMDDEVKEKLKAALWFSIGKIVDAESIRLNTTATPQFIGTLTEMVWTQIENVAIDLETFAHHASRSTITTDDVLLVTRRNETLEGIIRDYIDRGRAAKARSKERGEERRIGNGSGNGNGVGKSKRSVGAKTSRVEKGKGKGVGVKRNGTGKRGS